MQDPNGFKPNLEGFQENSLDGSNQVKCGYMQKNDHDLEGIKEKKTKVGFFTMLKTTGFIPYNAVPTHKSEIAENTNMEDVKTGVYWTRWYILFLSSLLFFNLVLVWGTFGPIAETVLYAYGTFHAQTIASFTLYTSIIIFFFGLPMNWVVQSTGLRPGMIMVGIIGSLSATIRCLSHDDYTFKLLCTVCSWTLGFAMSITLSLPAPIASEWFPLKERTFATAISGIATQLGYAGIYLAALFVKVPEDIEDPQDIYKSRHEIEALVKVYASTFWVLTILVILYFPSRPPIPPTLTASEKTLSFGNGVKSLIRNKNARLGVLAYIISYGVIAEWLGVISFTLTDMNFTQDEIMSTGIISITISAFASALSGAIADNFLEKKRIPILVLLIISACSFIMLLLMHLGLIQNHVAAVKAVIACGLGFQYAAMPLLVDMSVELAYPCSGNVVGSCKASGYNFLAIIFLTGYQFETESYLWVSVCLVLSQTLPLIPLLYIHETSIKKERDTLHLSLTYNLANKNENFSMSTTRKQMVEQEKVINSRTMPDMKN